MSCSRSDESAFMSKVCSICRTGSEKTEVAYEIYKDVKDGDPSSGILLEEGVSRHLFAGYHKIDLKEEHSLKKGEKYSVVLTMKRVNGSDDSMVYTEYVPYSTDFHAGVSVNGVINKGESYLYSNGKWSDMTDIKESLTDKAFSQSAVDITNNKLVPPLEGITRDRIRIDNYPIKAILTPSA